MPEPLTREEIERMPTDSGDGYTDDALAEIAESMRAEGRRPLQIAPPPPLRPPSSLRSPPHRPPYPRRPSQWAYPQPLLV